MIQYLERPPKLNKAALWAWDYFVEANHGRAPLRLLYHHDLKEWHAEFDNGIVVGIKPSDIWHQRARIRSALLQRHAST